MNTFKARNIGQTEMIWLVKKMVGMEGANVRNMVGTYRQRQTLTGLLPSGLLAGACN